LCGREVVNSYLGLGPEYQFSLDPTNFNQKMHLVKYNPWQASNSYVFR
jgi:hypothetical protein